MFERLKAIQSAFLGAPMIHLIVFTSEHIYSSLLFYDVQCIPMLQMKKIELSGEQLRSRKVPCNAFFPSLNNTQHAYLSFNQPSSPQVEAKPSSRGRGI